MEETEAQIINFERICRLCLNEKRILTEIFEPTADNNNLTIDQKIMACATIDLCKDDGLPSRICIKCLASVNAAFEFRIQCENADKTLHDLHNLFMNSETNKGVEESAVGSVEKEKGREKEANNKDKNSEDFNQIIVIKKQEDSGASTTEDLFYIVNDAKPDYEADEKVFEGEVIYYDEEDDEETDARRQTEEEEQDDGNANGMTFAVEGESAETYQVIVDHRKADREGIGDRAIKEQKKKAGDTFEDAKKSPCPFCNKMLTRVDEHVRLLHRNRVYVCTKNGCGAEFLTLKNLQSHQLRCFDVEKAFKCSRCGKEFHRKSNFKAHARRHGDRKEFQCQLCERAFVDSTGLRRHFLKHHEPEQEVFVSGCCGKRFKSKEGLKKHIRKRICGIRIYQVVDEGREMGGETTGTW